MKKTENLMALKEFAEKVGVSVTTLWNWHRKGIISIREATSPHLSIDSSIYPPDSLKPLKRGKGSPLYKKRKK